MEGTEEKATRRILGESWNILWVDMSMDNDGNGYQEEKEKSQEERNKGEKGRVG